MVGEIGGNDYNYALFQGKTIEEARYMVVEVVQAITMPCYSKFYQQRNLKKKKKKKKNPSFFLQNDLL